MNPARRGRGRPKLRSDDEQRAEIVSAASRLFLQSGFFGARMDDIAAECGMSKRTLYRLFPSKLTLFRAIAIRQREAMLDLDALGREATLERGLRATFRIGLDRHLDTMRQRFFAQATRDAADAPALIEIIKKECLEEVRILLGERLSMRATARKPSVKNPEIVASVLVDMIIGPLFLGHGRDAKDECKTVEACIHFFVNGIE